MEKTMKRCVAILAVLVAAGFASPASAVDTTFTYQGQLTKDGTPVNGPCDLYFFLYDAAAGGNGFPCTQCPEVHSGVQVTDGRFSVELNRAAFFGPTAFTGGNRWLEIATHCVGDADAALTYLAPRQAVTASPYALYASVAGSVEASSVTGAMVLDGSVMPADVGFNYAASSAKGGPASDVACTACVDAAEIGFNYAASSAKGGPATDLVCSGCVGSTDLGGGQVVRSINQLKDDVILSAGENTKITAVGNTLTIGSVVAGDITGVSVGAGLTGGGMTGTVGVAVDFAGGGSATTVARSDHGHVGSVWSGSPFSIVGLGLFPQPILKAKNTGMGLYAGAGLFGESAEDSGVVGSSAKASSNKQAGVYGVSTGSNGIGVHGVANTGSSASGVWGESEDGVGVRGASISGIGIHGETDGGALLNNTIGAVVGDSNGAGGIGVIGRANADGRGVLGSAAGAGVGVQGASSTGIGVLGSAGKSGGGRAGQFEGDVVINDGRLLIQGPPNSHGARSTFVDIHDDYASINAVNWGIGDIRSTGEFDQNIDVFYDSDCMQDIFNFTHCSRELTIYGDLNVAGDKNFQIDHPLDPANKYLRHVALEGPERLNVYSGNVTTDANGRAAVALPEYFMALNADCRYQLTVIGQFAQAIVAEKVRDNRFVIETDKPLVEVSWQVTGVRQDAWALAHPYIAELDKPEERRGGPVSP